MINFGGCVKVCVRMVHICNQLVMFGASRNFILVGDSVIVRNKPKIDKRLKRKCDACFLFGIKIVSYFKSCLFGQELI